MPHLQSSCVRADCGGVVVAEEDRVPANRAARIRGVVVGARGHAADHEIAVQAGAGTRS